MGSIRAAMKELTFKPKVVGIFGNQDSGKTFLSMLIAYYHMLAGGHVLSNIPLGVWDKEQQKPVTPAMPPLYHFVSSFSEMFMVISEELYKDPEAHFLALVDEAATKFSAGSWASAMSVLFTSAITLCRKTSTTFVIMAIRRDILLKRLRTDEEGLLHVLFHKEPFMLQKYARAALNRGYSPKQLALVYWPEKGTGYDLLVLKPTNWLAIPLEQAKETGAIFFDSGGISTMRIGKHPISGKEFNFNEMIESIEGPSWDVPEKLYRYMHDAPKVPEIETADLQPVEPSKATTSKTTKQRGASTQKDVQSRVDELLVQGVQAKLVAQEVGCSERFVWQRKAVLKAAGRLPG